MSIDGIIRTVLLALALVNQVLTACGLSILPIDNATVTNLLSTGFTVTMAIISWWKNNSVTEAAKAGDKVMYYIKSGAVTAEDVIGEVFDTSKDFSDGM